MFFLDSWSIISSLDVIQIKVPNSVEVSFLNNLIFLLKITCSNKLKICVWVAEVNVPVVGGHAGITILPLFSQVCPFSSSL